MNFLFTLAQRNQAFADQRFSAGLKMMPSRQTIIIGCVDPRVDPHDIFGLETGEAAVIRNVGGRVTAHTLESMALVGSLAKAAGNPVGKGWNLVVLHHTDCGIVGCSHLAPALLARHLGMATTGIGIGIDTEIDFDAVAIADPQASVALDVAALKANPALPAGLTVSGAVYDVATGKVEIVVPPAPLRPELP